MSFAYVSPGETEVLGTLSLTFYASTSRLHVQGSSYLLWVADHLPHILAAAEDELSHDPGKWNKLTAARGVGVTKRRTRLTKRANSRSSVSDYPPSSILWPTRASQLMTMRTR